MKRILILGMCVLMIFSMVACTNNDDNNGTNNNGTNNNGTNTDNNGTNNNGTNTDNTNNGNTGTNTDNTGNAGNAGNNDNAGNNTDNTGNVANEALAQIITAGRDDETNEAMSIVTSSNHEMAELTFSMLGIDEADLEEYAISLSPMNVRAYCVAIVKPVTGKADVIKGALTNYKDAQVKSFEQYLEDQYQIAQNTIMEESGDYIVFVMADQAETLRDSLVKGLNQ